MSRGFIHLFSQLDCGAGTGGAPTTDSPYRFSGSAPRPLPSRGREAQRLLDRVQTDRPFGRMPQQRIPDHEPWERRGEVALSPPKALNIRSAPPTLPLSSPPSPHQCSPKESATTEAT